MAHLACVRHKQRIYIALDPGENLGVSVVHRNDGSACVSKRVKTGNQEFSVQDAATVLQMRASSRNLSGKKRTHHSQ
jgi:hypothetical protein